MLIVTIGLDIKENILQLQKEKLDRISFGKVFTTEFFLVFSGFSVILSFIFLEITSFFFGFLFIFSYFRSQNTVKSRIDVLFDWDLVTKKHWV